MLRLHLDTDLGGDIDDLCALAMVLNWPDVALLAVTTVADDQGRRAGYARYALGLAGREDIAVAAGADVSLDCYRSRPGLPDEEVYWPEPIPPAPTSLDQALSLLERSIEQGAIIAAIGPYTNLALLEKRSPGILRRARLYLMGGYVFPPRAGFPPWGNHLDYNVQVDVQSAQYVIQRSSPTLVPLSVTVETSLRRAYLATLRQSGPLAQLIARQAEAFAQDWNYEAQYGQTCQGLPEDTINFQHDPLTCAIALGWNEGVVTSEIPLKLEIQGGWLCQRVDDSGKPTRVVTRVNGGKFNEFWLSTVVRKNAVTSTPNCLRCSGVELRRLPESTKDIMFFECPSCRRHYAQEPGRALVYRWLQPITLPLYAILFDLEPLARVQDVAADFVRNRSSDELARIIAEIELELQHPTQNIRDILDNRASEEKCREFLQAFVAQVRSAL